MKSIIILLALVAFCQAAPLDTKDSTPETSTLGVGPINPDVISEPKPTEGKVVLLKDSPLNRQKRDEHKKPDSVKAREGLQHDPHRQPLEHPKVAPVKPDSVKAHEGLQHNPHKREAHHEPGHQEQPQTEDLPVPHALPSAAPAVELTKKEKRETEEKPDSVKTKESLPDIVQPVTLQGDNVKEHTEEHPAEKKVKREAHHEEGHTEQPQADLPVPHALPTAAPAVDLAKKQEKRETQEKPDQTKESNTPHELGATATDVPDVVKALSGVHPASDLLKKQKRDIPVPTQTKATAEPAATTKSEGGSTTPSAPHFKRPVPVDVLLHQKPSEKSTSSSEESKESKEKVKA